MTIYPFIKLIHIVAAILALGFNLSYLVWFAKGKKQSEHLLYTLQGVRFMDNVIANPCYMLILASGFAMYHLGHYEILKTTWMLYSVILFSVMGAIGFGAYTPALSNQIKTLKEHGFESIAYAQAEKKQTRLGFVLFVLALTIVTLMVTKPM